MVIWGAGILMIIKININPFLTHITDNQGIVEVSENNIVQFIQQLVARFLSLESRYLVWTGS